MRVHHRLKIRIQRGRSSRSSSKEGAGRLQCAPRSVIRIGPLQKVGFKRAGVAQLVEQLTCNEKVEGSIPFTGTTSRMPDALGHFFLPPEGPVRASVRSMVRIRGSIKYPRFQAFLLVTESLFSTYAKVVPQATTSKPAPWRDCRLNKLLHASKHVYLNSFCTQLSDLL